MRGALRLLPSNLIRHAKMSTTQPAAQGSDKIFPPSDPSNPTQAAQFTQGPLDPSTLHADPYAQFRAWVADAAAAHVPLPEACTLSTAALPSGRVSSRTVYLKGASEHGFVVYSNWGTSRKAADVASNPRASLCFWWRELERQVRVEGRVERLSSAESQPYFDSRIRGSRIGAWASEQTKVLRDRDELVQRVEAVERRFDGVEQIPVPDFWGGMRVLPEEIEFWQGRQSRLHDRFRYTSVEGDGGGTWKIERLSP